MKILCRIIPYIVGTFFCALSCHSAYSQTSYGLLLGGTQWKIPAAYVLAQPPTDKTPHSVTLQFELPSFTPVNPKDFLGVPPAGASSILFVTITDDRNDLIEPTQPDQIKAHAELNCMTCIGDSSLGGKTYSNYAMQNFSHHDAKNEVPYNLFANQPRPTDWSYSISGQG